jgi:hypothetical protein
MKTARPNDRETDNRHLFAARLKDLREADAAIPADYEIGQQKLAEYHRFKGMAEVLLAVIVFLTLSLGLVGFFFDFN